MRTPWFTALVAGPSMAPTLRHNDAILVRRVSDGRLPVRKAPVRPGDVVIGRFRSRPDLLVVKRVRGAEGDGWWLIGDNELIQDDSRAYGVADVLGRVVLRWWPQPRMVARRRYP